MSEQATAQPTVPVKRASGWLVMSLLMTLSLYIMGFLFGGYLFLVAYSYLGVVPMIGLVMAVLGYRAVKRDPMLKGPRFAIVCIVLAVIATGHQSFLRYQLLPIKSFLEAVGTVQRDFFNSLSKRNYEGVHSAMGPGYQEAHTVEEVRQQLVSALPGEDEIVLKNNLRIIEEELDRKAEERRQTKLFEGDQATVDFLYPYEMRRGDERVRLALTIRVERRGRSEISAELIDFAAGPLPEKKEGGPEPAKPGDKPTEDKPAEEKPPPEPEKDGGPK